MHILVERRSRYVTFHGSKIFGWQQTENSLEKRFRTVSNFIDLIQFHLICQKLAKFSGLNPKGPYLSLDKKKTKIFVLCLPTPWSGRVKLGSLKKKSVMHVQSCRFANTNLRFFCRSRYRRRCLCLSSVLLWSKHFATMVTWRHTSLSSVSLGATLTPEGNWRQCLCKILEWQSKSIMVCYGILCSGQLQTPWMKRNVFSVTFRLSTLDW